VPSESFGYWQATTLLVLIRFHIGAKQPWNSFRPKKNMVEYLNVVVGLCGLPPSPAYQDSHGTTVDRQGVPSFSAAAATGLVVSGVEVVRIMSTLFCRISWRATVDARFGSDWLSCTTILIL
jgi:hypothetical protein